MTGELHDDLREGRVDSVFVLRVMGKSSANRGSLGRTYLQIADEIERLRAALQPFADCGWHLGNHKFVPTPDTGIWVPRTTNDPQPPSILVKHLLDAAKVLPD